MRALLTRHQRLRAQDLRAQGWKINDIARELGCQVGVIQRATYRPPWQLVAPAAGWIPGPGRLSIAEREEISRRLSVGESFGAIARHLGRAVSSISREVAANGGRGEYRAYLAHRRAYEAARRPKPYKLACPRLAAEVTEALEKLWSPEEISRRLRRDHPDDPMMRVSHETIYQSLFVQGRGELRRELHRCLRSGRATRRPQGTGKKGGPIPGMVMISERPAEAADRAVPGHWEGDLIKGRSNRSAVGTLVERATRYVMLLHLPDGWDAASVEKAMKAAIVRLPDELAGALDSAERKDLFKTITWDQGREMANHLRFSADTGVQIYFCDPHSPWQRGSNENTNGLLRQYMPKGTDLSVHSAEDLARFAASLNDRPRKTLDWMKPWEKLTEVLADTA